MKHFTLGILCMLIVGASLGFQETDPPPDEITIDNVLEVVAQNKRDIARHHETLLKWREYADRKEQQIEVFRANEKTLEDEIALLKGRLDALENPAP